MIFGVSGKKQTGKNTIGRIIQAIHMWHIIKPTKTIEEFCMEYLDPNFNSNNFSKFKCISFADILKKMATILTGFPDVSVWESSQVKDLYNPTFEVTNREILQILGQSLRDNLHPDVWVNALFERYFKTENWIITDVRMPNEFKAIKDRDGIVIRVNRNTGYNDNHISETALDDCKDFDFIIDNNGSVEELIKKVIEIYDKLF